MSVSGKQNGDTATRSVPSGVTEVISGKQNGDTATHSVPSGVTEVTRCPNFSAFDARHFMPSHHPRRGLQVVMPDLLYGDDGRVVSFADDAYLAKRCKDYILEDIRSDPTGDSMAVAQAAAQRFLSDYRGQLKKLPSWDGEVTTDLNIVDQLGNGGKSMQLLTTFTSQLQHPPEYPFSDTVSNLTLDETQLSFTFHRNIPDPRTEGRRIELSEGCADAAVRYAIRRASSSLHNYSGSTAAEAASLISAYFGDSVWPRSAGSSRMEDVVKDQRKAQQGIIEQELNDALSTFLSPAAAKVSALWNSVNSAPASMPPSTEEQQVAITVPLFGRTVNVTATSVPDAHPRCALPAQ